MDVFEKINRAFGGWYEGLFGASDDVRPKDVLRRILAALEEHRKEGFDSKVYVPNQYILEIAVDDPEEKEYLLSFLDREELETAIRRYCQQNHYHIRGKLDFTVKEVEPGEGEARRREKVRVKCRYDSKLAAEKEIPAPEASPAVAAPEREREPEDEATIARVDYSDSDETGTVPAIATARLTVHTPGQPLGIGRSRAAGSDIVLPEDGMVSRRHARIEMDPDGRFTVYDLQTTNGTRVNGKRIDNVTLSDGDEIMIGGTRIVFHQEGADRPRAAASQPAAATAHVGAAGAARLVLTDGARDLEAYVLASETVVGRGVTNDISLSDRSVGTRHVRITRGAPWTLEVLDATLLTLLNGTPVTGRAVPIRDGDRIGIGTLTLRFEEPAP
jgi:pSer/pThr/pTyr-binding forkhead associated (FHA) protein